jgi:hypothetical protein
MGSIPNKFFKIFHQHNPSGHGAPLGSDQSLTFSFYLYLYLLTSLTNVIFTQVKHAQTLTGDQIRHRHTSMWIP